MGETLRKTNTERDKKEQILRGANSEGITLRKQDMERERHCKENILKEEFLSKFFGGCRSDKKNKCKKTVRGEIRFLAKPYTY